RGKSRPGQGGRGLARNLRADFRTPLIRGVPGQNASGMQTSEAVRHSDSASQANRAMPEVLAGVAQTFFAAMSRSPTFRRHVRAFVARETSATRDSRDTITKS